MFDLEKSIADWRRQLTASGVASRDILDELESHLREDVEQQLRAGVTACGAFDLAVRRIGQGHSLKSEFSKIGANKRPSSRKIFRLTCFAFAPCVWLVGAWALWDYEIGATARVLGLISVSGIALCLAGLPFWYRRPDVLHGPVAGDFTELAQASLEAAREEAMCLHHDFIGTEHLLLGILATESGLLMDVFRKGLVDGDTVRREIEKWVGLGPVRKLPQEVPYTPRAKRAVGFAAREARAMNHSFITAEHLLLGLLLESEGVAGLVLRELGFDFESARAEILKGFGPDGDDGPQPVVA